MKGTCERSKEVEDKDEGDDEAGEVEAVDEGREGELDWCEGPSKREEGTEFESDGAERLDFGDVERGWAPVEGALVKNPTRPESRSPWMGISGPEIEGLCPYRPPACAALTSPTFLARRAARPPGEVGRGGTLTRRKDRGCP